MLDGNCISLHYGLEPVLDEVSLRIKEGEIHQVSGPSGGGKTTLLRVLSLLDAPKAGQILLDGREFRHGHLFAPSTWIRNEPFRRSVTLVSQQIFLWPHLTCRQNIEFVHAGRDTYAELAERLNVAHCLNRYPNQASIGQRQRIALIRAIVTRPRYLLLDEVTSALDQEMCAISTGLIEQLAIDGMGVLMVTHRDHDWKRITPKRWWIEHGRLLWIS